MAWLAWSTSEQDVGLLGAMFAGMRKDARLAQAMRRILRRDQTAMTDGLVRHAAELAAGAAALFTIERVRYGDGEQDRILGTTDAGGLPALAELADLAVTGDLHIPIAATYPLTAVHDAYQALADRKTHGRIVLHPQDLV